MFEKHAAQGEIKIKRIEELPQAVKPLNQTESGPWIIGHSETGHHHVLERERADVFEAESAPEGMRILYAIVKDPTSLDHKRGHDTHKSISLSPGIYEFRSAREYDPYADLARRVAD